MLNYLEAKDRERLLKKLEPRYKHAKLVLFGMPIEIDGRVFEPDFYLIVENADREIGKGIKGWNIPSKYRKCFKVVKDTRLNSFLYWREE